MDSGLDASSTKAKYPKYTDIVFLFLVSRVAFFLIILVSRTTLSEFMVVFDSEHYTRIAQKGYEEYYLTAFFPMIPLLLRCLSWYGLIAVNQICLFISMILLKNLLEDTYKSSMTNMILLIFAFSPVSYFSLVAYTESIFFTLTLAAFYMFAKNKKPWLMGIFLGLSVFTRNTGSIVFFSLFIGMVIRWIKKENKLTDILQAYVPATIISVIYPIFLQVKFGNWKIFVDSEFSYWARIHSNFFKTNYISLKMIFVSDYGHDKYTLTLYRINEIITIVITLFLICLCVKEIRKIKKCDTISIASVLVVIMAIFIFAATIIDPYVYAPTRCFYRYYLALFPSFTLLHDMKPKFMNVLMIISLFAGLFMSIVFFKGTFFC